MKLRGSEESDLSPIVALVPEAWGALIDYESLAAVDR